LLPVVELLRLVALLLRIPFLHRGRRTHQRMRLLRRPCLFPLRRTIGLRATIILRRIPILSRWLRISVLRRSLHLNPPVRLSRSVPTRRSKWPEASIRFLWSTRLTWLRGPGRLRLGRFWPDKGLLVQTPACLRLSLLERSRRRGRCSLGHDLPVDYGRWRLYWCRPSRTEYALANRLNRDHVRNRSGCDFFGLNAHDILRDRPCIYERLMGDYRYGIVHVLVHISDAIDIVVVVVHHNRVVDIRDLGDVHHGIGDVHVVHVAAAHAIAGDEHFSRSQWKPSHTNSGCEVKAPTAANEGN